MTTINTLFGPGALLDPATGDFNINLKDLISHDTPPKWVALNTAPAALTALASDRFGGDKIATMILYSMMQNIENSVSPPLFIFPPTAVTEGSDINKTIVTIAGKSELYVALQGTWQVLQKIPNAYSDPNEIGY